MFKPEYHRQMSLKGVCLKEFLRPVANENLVRVSPWIPEIGTIAIVIDIPPLHEKLREALFTSKGNALNPRSSRIVKVDIFGDPMGSERSSRRWVHKQVKHPFR